MPGLEHKASPVVQRGSACSAGSEPSDSGVGRDRVMLATRRPSGPQLSAGGRRARNAAATPTSVERASANAATKERAKSAIRLEIRWAGLITCASAPRAGKAQRDKE